MKFNLSFKILSLIIFIVGCTAVNPLERKFPRQTKQRLQNEACDSSEIDYYPEIIGGYNAILDARRVPNDFKDSSLVNLTVTVRALIDTNGLCIKAEVLDSVGYGCDEEAIRIAKKLQYHPAIACDSKKKSYLSFGVPFRGRNSQLAYLIEDYSYSGIEKKNWTTSAQISFSDTNYYMKLFPGTNTVDGTKYSEINNILLNLNGQNKVTLLHGDVSALPLLINEFNLGHFVTIVEKSSKRQCKGLLFLGMVSREMSNYNYCKIEISKELFELAHSGQKVFISEMEKVPSNKTIVIKDTKVTEYAKYVLWFSKEHFGHWSF